jgi:NAD(P)-dependent dehydrogenase (short-subunit alcohol dehydrogenase family)
MSYAIIGFGKIGQALAHAFARKNIDVTVASHRPHEALAPQARAIGPTVVAKSLREALEADTIILAVPFGEHREVAKALPNWKGKTIIDVTNALACPLRNWEDSPLPRPSRRPLLADDWLRASTIWSLPSLNKIRPNMGASASFFWRATMTVPQMRLVRLQKISVLRRSNLAGFRKAGCLCRRAETLGAG